MIKFHSTKWHKRSGSCLLWVPVELLTVHLWMSIVSHCLLFCSRMPETDGARTPEVEAAEECGNEPPMYIERPSSARSQDVTHILVRTFRDLFTRDTIAPDTIQYLNTSRCSDDEYHQQYVDALLKVTDVEFCHLETALSYTNAAYFLQSPLDTSLQVLLPVTVFLYLRSDIVSVIFGHVHRFSYLLTYLLCSLCTCLQNKQQITCMKH